LAREKAEREARRQQKKSALDATAAADAGKERAQTQMQAAVERAEGRRAAAMEQAEKRRAGVDAGPGTDPERKHEA
jgi:hypothetical protein